MCARLALDRWGVSNYVRGTDCTFFWTTWINVALMSSQFNIVPTIRESPKNHMCTVQDIVIQFDSNFWI